jgi:hypothetical protein
MEAAVKALDNQASSTSAVERQLELALAQARYEAAHARRQYDAVDPVNRLVAGELERRWNEALTAVNRIEGEIAAIATRKPPPLGEAERQQLIALGSDLARAWAHPAATATTRKRILRAALQEIVVRKDGAIMGESGFQTSGVAVAIHPAVRASVSMPGGYLDANNASGAQVHHFSRGERFARFKRCLSKSVKC